MRFLIDAQLPPALARLLTERGHEAEHVADRQMAAASDRQIWDYALAADAVIVTKDEDFAQRRALGENGPRVVWVRIRNTRRRELLVWFSSILPAVLAALERGETLIELI
jgi:predicted nuclease of predicted toxin-antitoxin system